MKHGVFYEVCDGSPGSGPLEPGWGSCDCLKTAMARLNNVRTDGFAEAYLANVTYERCPEPEPAKR
jgi:hypothetical protein